MKKILIATMIALSATAALAKGGAAVRINAPHPVVHTSNLTAIPVIAATAATHQAIYNKPFTESDDNRNKLNNAAIIFGSLSVFGIALLLVRRIYS